MPLPDAALLVHARRNNVRHLLAYALYWIHAAPLQATANVTRD